MRWNCDERNLLNTHFCTGVVWDRLRVDLEQTLEFVVFVEVFFFFLTFEILLCAKRGETF